MIAIIVQLFRVLSLKQSGEKREQETVAGYDGFCLDMTVPWPITLVVNKRTIIKYQILFRQMFRIKVLERQLSQTWMDYKEARQFALAFGFARAHSLRNRMLLFLSSLQYYMSYEVFETNWEMMTTRLSSV